MKNKNLQSELDWVDKHTWLYMDDTHREDAKHNITVNYEIRELEGTLNTLRDEERNPLRLRIAELRDTLRPSRIPDYIPIKCPPIPKTDAELRELAGQYKRQAETQTGDDPETAALKAKYGDKWWKYAVPGRVENTGIRDRVVVIGTCDHSVEP